MAFRGDKRVPWGEVMVADMLPAGSVITFDAQQNRLEVTDAAGKVLVVAQPFVIPDIRGRL